MGEVEHMVPQWNRWCLDGRGEAHGAGWTSGSTWCLSGQVGAYGAQMDMGKHVVTQWCTWCLDR